MIREAFNDNWQFKKGMDGMFAMPGEILHITLPHDAMILEMRDRNCPNSNATGFYPGGTYTYLKKFYVSQEDSDKDIYLEFEGVYMNAMVYINGNLAGKRPYGYSNFCVKVNDFLKYGGENEIKVTAKSGSMPNSRWYSGSGIYRDVKIMKADTLHITPDGLKISTKSTDDGMAVIEVAATLENNNRHSRFIRIKTTILDADGSEVASDSTAVTIFAGDSFTVRGGLTVRRPQLWDTESPYLYTCICRLIESGKVIDETVEKFGVRMLALDAERGLRINGSPVKLRGACIHHDNGVIGACTFRRAEERRAEILKRAGFNAIRSAHHPMSKAMLDACDRLGILVMDEAFDMWQMSKSDYDYSLYFDEWWEKDMEAMVAKDYNHPCVIIYSLGNEIFEAGTKKGACLNRKMAEKIRALDPTRYVTNCINGFLAAFPYMDEIMEELTGQDGAESQLQGDAKPQLQEGGVEPAGEINQFMMNIFGMQDQIAGSCKVAEILEETFAGVDIAGYNYMVGRYDTEKELYPNRVIAGSETCPPDIGIIWKKVIDYPNIIGDFTWTGWDYLGEAGVGAFSYEGGGFFKPYPALLAFSGDIDITGHRRPMSYYREIVFGLRKEPYIAVQRVNRHGRKVNKTQWCGSDTVSSWTWPGFEGKPAVIEVFSNAHEVELLLNGQTLGRKSAGMEKLYTAVFDITYQPGELEAVNYTDGVETGRMQLQTAGDSLKLEVEADRTQLKADGADLSYLMLSLTDDKGIVNMSGTLPVTVIVEGPAVLQGFGSADPYGTENFFDTTRTTFDGKVLAVVRSMKKAGDIRVIFTAPECEPQTVLLSSE